MAAESVFVGAAGGPVIKQGGYRGRDVDTGAEMKLDKNDAMHYNHIHNEKTVKRVSTDGKLPREKTWHGKCG